MGVLCERPSRKTYEGRTAILSTNAVALRNDSDEETSHAMIELG